MLIVPENSAASEPPRTHPWGKTEYEEDAGAYFDFTERPELIPQVLEDFRPHASQGAVQTFYALLAWINGSESAFETNDCALKPPAKNDNMFRFAYFIGGRLEFLFRNHAADINEPSIRWLFQLLCMYVQVTNPGFLKGTISAEIIPTEYVHPLKPNGSGFRLRLTFQAYGDSPHDSWQSLQTVFEGLLTVFRRLNAAMRVPMPEFP